MSDVLTKHRKTRHRSQKSRFCAIKYNTNWWYEKKRKRQKVVRGSWNECGIGTFLTIFLSNFCQNSSRGKVDKHFAKFCQAFVNLLFLAFCCSIFCQNFANILG